MPQRRSCLELIRRSGRSGSSASINAPVSCARQAKRLATEPHVRILSTMTQGPGDERLAAEQRARVLIDRQLADAGWSVQDKKDLNLYASQGVACREAVMKQGHGRADYLLYVDQKVVGVIEAKPAGTSLSGVECSRPCMPKGYLQLSASGR